MSCWLEFVQKSSETMLCRLWCLFCSFPDRVRCFVFVFHWFAHPHLVDVWLLSLQTHHIGYNIWTEIAVSALISNRLTYTGTDTMGLLFCLLKPGLEAALMLSTDALTCYNMGLKAGGMTTRVHEYSCQISVARRLRLYVQDIFLYFRITLGHFSVLPYLDAPPGYSKSWYFWGITEKATSYEYRW